MGHQWSGHDPKEEARVKFGPEDADRIMVCTPTANHVQDIRDLLKYGKPIICEKPLCKDRTELGDLLSDVQSAKVKLEMINQYSYLTHSSGKDGITEYDYFRSGGDGLFWDCINILAIARGEVRLANFSPIWKCTINGDRMSLSDMDSAYVSNVSAWLNSPIDNTEYIWAAHERVHKAMEQRSEENSNRDTGTQH